MKSELIMLKIEVSRLPHLLQRASIPPKIVARVDQNETSYAMNIHFATSSYASKASVPLLPKIFVSRFSVLFLSEAMPL